MMAPPKMALSQRSPKIDLSSAIPIKNAQMANNSSSGGFLSRLFGSGISKNVEKTAPIGSVLSAPKKQQFQARSSFNDEAMDYSEEEELNTVQSKKPENKTPVTLDNYQTITNAQHPSGHWSDVTAFNAKFDIKDLIWKKISDEKISGTVYALILLFSLFQNQYNEWKLSAIKGVAILKSHFGEEKVVDEFQKIVSETGCEFDDELVDEL